MTNILVVEDNAGLRRLMSIHLSRAGYTVLEAEDGLAALEILDHNHVHLIIADVMMPRMDGYTLTKELRDAGVRTPILLGGLTARMLTCRGFREAVVTCLRSDRPVIVAADDDAEELLRALTDESAQLWMPVPESAQGQAALLEELIAEAAMRL